MTYLPSARSLANTLKRHGGEPLVRNGERYSDTEESREFLALWRVFDSRNAEPGIEIVTMFGDTWERTSTADRRGLAREALRRLRAVWYPAFGAGG